MEEKERTVKLRLVPLRQPLNTRSGSWLFNEREFTKFNW